jgi:hypothetical protein
MAKAKKQAKKSAGAAKVAMTVTPSGARPIHDVAKDLEAAGFKLNEVLDGIGSITGHAHRGLVGKLESIKGVGKGGVVEDPEDIQLPSPGEPQ